MDETQKKDLIEMLAECEAIFGGLGRDPSRIDGFLAEAGSLWKRFAPGEGFGSLMVGLIRACSDPFHWEENTFLRKLREYLAPRGETAASEECAGRIDAFLLEIAAPWKENLPDWRFGQLMFNFISESGDPTGWTDSRFAAALQEYISRFAPKKPASPFPPLPELTEEELEHFFDDMDSRDPT